MIERCFGCRTNHSDVLGIFPWEVKDKPMLISQRSVTGQLLGFPSVSWKVTHGKAHAFVGTISISRKDGYGEIIITPTSILTMWRAGWPPSTTVEVIDAVKKGLNLGFHSGVEQFW
jgi:hypothetical protein